jgi:hypothetical protein
MKLELLQEKDLGESCGDVKTQLVRGLIKSAISNKLISTIDLVKRNAVVTFTNQQGEVYTATILDGSVYQVKLPIGSYKRKSVADGFTSISEQVDIVRSANENDSRNTVLLSPSMGSGFWRVVLTWGKNPLDLDLYAILPDGNRIYWKNNKTEDGSVYLDIDDRDGEGPETITFKTLPVGTTKIIANNYYDARSTKPQIPFAFTQAKLTVYRGDVLDSIYYVPQTNIDDSKSIWWKVISFDGATGTYEVNDKLQINTK